MEPFDATLRFLAEVRRELAKVARAEVFFAALMAIAVAVVFGFGVASALGVGAGRWGWVPLGFGVAGIVGLAWWLGVRPGRARKDDSELALWVEAQVPGLESGLVTAVQAAPLIRSQAPETLGFSPALASAAALRTAERTRNVEVSRLPDRTRLAKLRWGALGAVVALGVVALAAPDFYTRGAVHLTSAPPADTDGDGRVVDVVVSQLDVEIKAPPYTHLKPRRVPRSAGDIEAFKGSEVKFTGTVLYPATAAALVLESNPEARWMLELETDGTVRGGLRVGQDDRYQIVLTDPDGELIKERVWRKVVAKEDRAPEVTLLLPETDLEVKPEGEIAFFFETSDDLGLEKVELVVQGEDGKELVRRVVNAAAGETLVKDDATVEVAKLGLEPGQSADVWFEGTDQNNMEGGPGVGKSASRKLTLYSPADEHDQILSDLRAVVEKMLDVLADRLESPVDKGRPDLIAQFAEAHAGMLMQTGAVLAEMDRLSGLLSTDPLASEGMRDGVRAIRDSLTGVNEQERAHLAKWDADPDLVEPRVWVTLLQQTNEESVTVLEQGILQLKKLIDGALKDAILEAGREMLDTQNEMMEILKELKEKNDPAAREAALKKLQQLQKKLQELQQKLAKLQEKTPYENQNPAQRPSENQEEAASLQDKMQEIQKLLEEGKVDEAMKMLEELSKSTQEMMAGLQDDLDSIGGGGGSSESKRKLSEAKEELDQLANGQRGLQREANEAGKEIDERQRKELMQKAQAELDEMRGEAKKIRDELGKAKTGGLHPDDKASLEKLEGAAAELEQAIENARAGDAQGKAGEVSGGSEQLGNEIGESEAREMDRDRLSELRSSMDHLKQAGEAAKALGEKLAGMQPKPGEGLTPKEGQQMSQLGKQQGELEQKLKSLQEKMKGLGEEMPEVGDAMKDALEQAGKAMGEAKGELEGKKPGSAQEKQQEALEKLQEAQQNLDEQMKQQQQNGQSDDNNGLNDPKAKVGIPKDDPYASPRNLREEILKAMGERAPDAYRDAIRKFYEELTK